ncbi:hypothetical protein F66182_4463 [Fusarium sp. NRRL 66182]|nr:hypothetical protein F66182_4463 [Fusarium sp. NRRL 66182]
MANIRIVVDDQQQQSLKIAQTPSFCRLCNVELRGLQTWKSHLKSDAHVFKLQSKAAEPGTDTSPPTPPCATDVRRPKGRDRVEPDVDVDQDLDIDSEEDEDEDEEELFITEFAQGSCLFCAHDSNTLDDNMTHMATAHGFNIPFQNLLGVDLETVVSYLHFIIYAYRECICCGTRRSTLEGIQQHMMAKGHCRFDISSEIEEFYQMPQSDNILAETTQDPSIPVRLPSGKLISHRNHLEAQEPRPRRQAPDQSHLESNPSSSSPPLSPSLEVAHRGGVHGRREMVRANEAILAAQLSRLKVVGDRAQQREEKRWRGRLERANNAFAQHRFVVDSGDARMGRKFRF